MPTATWETLCRRADLLRRLRRFFDERDFVEVETPVLSADTVVDRHLDPLPVTLFDDPRSPELGRRFWLQTSPEFAMKRLLVAGAQRIYQVTRAFRGGEQGRLHNPEFTMVEWYRVGDDYRAGKRLLADLVEWLLPRGPVEFLRYAEAFQRCLGLDPHTATVDELVEAGCNQGLTPPAFAVTERDAWLDWLLVEIVEPQLGRAAPTILYDYPASQSALARINPGPPAVAERFELYIDGIELANGYHELLDPDLLIERTRQANEERRTDGKYTLPETSRLVDAMRQGLAPCAGVALGFDRFVMVALGASSIADVMAFPTDIA